MVTPENNDRILAWTMTVERIEQLADEGIDKRSAGVVAVEQAALLGGRQNSDRDRQGFARTVGFEVVVRA